MTCFAQRSGKRRAHHAPTRLPDGQLICMRCDTWLDSDGNEVLLTADELSRLDVVAGIAADRVEARTAIGIESGIALLLPRLLAEVTARRRSRPRRGRR